MPGVAAGGASGTDDQDGADQQQDGADQQQDGTDQQPGGSPDGEVASDGVPGQDRPDGEEATGKAAELERALGDLDGHILDKRIAAQDRAKSPSEATPGSPKGEDDGAAEPGADGEGGGVAPGRRSVASTMPNTPPLPRPETPDLPDARDDDVVARQIREAAMAEKNPELRAALWDEYERYVSGLPGRRAKRKSNTAAQPQRQRLAHVGT